MLQIVLTMSAPYLYGYGATTGLHCYWTFKVIFLNQSKDYADIADMSILILALFFLLFFSSWINLSNCELPLVTLQCELEAERAECVHVYIAWQGVCLPLNYGKCRYCIFILGTLSSASYPTWWGEVIHTKGIFQQYLCKCHRNHLFIVDNYFFPVEWHPSLIGQNNKKVQNWPCQLW